MHEAKICLALELECRLNATRYPLLNVPSTAATR